MERDEYEKDLKRRQEQHLNNIETSRHSNYFGIEQAWQPCLHESCPECIGTGVKHDGSMCIHGISCPCPKCSTTC